MGIQLKVRWLACPDVEFSFNRSQRSDALSMEGTWRQQEDEEWYSSRDEASTVTIQRLKRCSRSSPITTPHCCCMLQAYKRLY